MLHGHNHRDNHVDFAWAEGRIPVIGVGSGSVGRVHRGEPLGRYNLLRITRAGRDAHIECITRGLDATGNFVEQVDRKLLETHQSSGAPSRAR